MFSGTHSVPRRKSSQFFKNVIWYSACLLPGYCPTTLWNLTMLLPWREIREDMGAHWDITNAHPGTHFLKKRNTKRYKGWILDFCWTVARLEAHIGLNDDNLIGTGEVNILGCLGTMQRCFCSWASVWRVWRNFCVFVWLFGSVVASRLCITCFKRQLVPFFSHVVVQRSHLHTPDHHTNRRQFFFLEGLVEHINMTAQIAEKSHSTEDLRSAVFSLLSLLPI